MLWSFAMALCCVSCHFFWLWSCVLDTTSAQLISTYDVISCAGRMFWPWSVNLLMIGNDKRTTDDVLVLVDGWVDGWMDGWMASLLDGWVVMCYGHRFWSCDSVSCSGHMLRSQVVISYPRQLFWSSDFVLVFLGRLTCSGHLFWSVPVMMAMVSCSGHGHGHLCCSCP